MEQEKQCGTFRSEMCDKIKKLLNGATLEQLCIIEQIVCGMLKQPEGKAKE